jgi:hypothetical protein
MDWLKDFLTYLGWTAVPAGQALKAPFPWPGLDRNAFQIEHVMTPDAVRDFLQQAARAGPLGSQTLGYMLRRLAGQFLTRPGAMNTIMPPVTPEMIRQIFSQVAPQG